jgi:hypothetical protein
MVDAFASSDNNICEKYFSKWPQTGAAGVIFFLTKDILVGNLLLLPTSKGDRAHNPEVAEARGHHSDSDISSLARTHILGHAAYKHRFCVGGQSVSRVGAGFPRHRASEVNILRESRHEDVWRSGRWEI